MFSKVEMPSDAFSGKTSKEAVVEKRECLTKRDTKTVLLRILLTFLIVTVIVQTICLMIFARRLRIVEGGASLSTQTMDTETMTLDEFSTKNTNRNRRSVSVLGYPTRHRRNTNEQITPSMPSAHLVANVKTSIAPGTYISWDTNSPGLRHNDFCNNCNTFIKVSSSGYYYVYAQLNLIGNVSVNHGQQYGFQVTRHYSQNDEVPSGQDATALLSANSVLFPIGHNMDSLETKFTGGTFLLCRNEAVGVRANALFKGLKITAGTDDIHSTSFFGLMQTKKLDQRLEGRYCRPPPANSDS